MKKSWRENNCVGMLGREAQVAVHLKYTWVPLRGNAYCQAGSQSRKSWVMVHYQALGRKPATIACPLSCLPTVDKEQPRWTKLAFVLP